MIARIRKAYSGAALQSEEARLVRQWDKETLEKAQEMWLEGVSAAARNLRNVEKSTEGNQKNMLRDIPSSFEQNINSVAKMGSVVSLTGNEFAKGSVDLITQVTDYFDSIGGIAHSKYGDVRLTRSGVKASIGHGIGRNKAIAFKAVQNVLQDGLMIDYQKNWKQRGYNTAVIAAPITISNTDYYMAAVVIEQARSNDYYLHEVILKEKENVAAFKTGTVKNGAPSAVTSSIYSILHDLQNSNTSTQKNQSRSDADYLSAVERGDMDTAQKMVDEAAEKAFADSKVRDKDGKLRKVYHYTNSDFFSFDTGRSGKNQGQTHGDGIYISTSPDEFSYAGKKRMTLYANIIYPFEMQLSEDQARYVLERYAVTKHNLDKYDGLYRNHAMSALQSSIKVFDYLKEYADDNNIKVSDILKDLGYDGVHDGSEWVAFSSGQLKSADPVTYDDNSNVISLSQRFDTVSSRRYAVPRTVFFTPFQILSLSYLNQQKG